MNDGISQKALMANSPTYETSNQFVAVNRLYQSFEIKHDRAYLQEPENKNLPLFFDSVTNANKFVDKLEEIKVEVSSRNSKINVILNKIYNEVAT